MKKYDQRLTLKKYENGFTLIEALITVVIIGIVASFALPSFTNVIKNQRVSAITNEVTTTLQIARTEAIKRSSVVRVCFKIQANGNQCQNLGGAVNLTNYMYVFIDDDDDQVRDGNEEVLYLSNKFNDSVLFTHPSDANKIIQKSISFGSKGDARFGVPGDSLNSNQREGVFGLCDDRKNNSVGRAIRIGKTGRVQVSTIRPTDNITC